MMLNCAKIQKCSTLSLKLCSQRMFLLKHLQDQRMPLQQLILQAILLNRITYAIPVWAPFISADLWQKIRAFLKRSWCYGFTTSICDVQPLLVSAMHDRLKMQNPDHCLVSVATPDRSTTNLLRERGHNNFELYN